MSLSLLTNPDHMLLQVFEEERYMESYYFDVIHTVTTSDSSDGKFKKGYNPILVPSSIFTNSYFYRHEILEGNGATNWPTLTFYGDGNPDSAVFYELSEES